MNATQTKIQKSSRIISIALRIGQIFAILGTTLCAAALLFILLGRAEYAEVLVSKGDAASAQSAAVLLPVLLGVMTALMGSVCAMCQPLIRMFGEISLEGTPFSPKHVGRIKTVAWLALIMSILSGTAHNAEMALRTGDPMILVSIEAMWIVFAFIIYCLAYIFDYGCQLQRESDETL